MELLVHRCNASACDGLVTSRTEGTSDSMVVNLTVRDALVIEKAATIEGLSALPTYKAVGVPLHIESSDIVVHYCHVAASTFWSKHVKVIFRAVCLAILLMETIFAKVLSTLSTEEMLWVPGLF